MCVGREKRRSASFLLELFVSFSFKRKRKKKKMTVINFSPFIKNNSSG
jgi:hypothetical protein